MLTVEINGRVVDEGALVYVGAQRVWVEAEDLRRWRLKRTASGRRGQRHALDELSGVGYHLDRRRMVLSIRAEADAFRATTLTGRGATKVTVSPRENGVFLNYDLLGEKRRGRSAGTSDHSEARGLFGLGVYSKWGVGTTSWKGVSGSDGKDWVRLESRWTDDRPERRASLRLGDSIGRAGTWGRSVRFGGLQWSTNFATQPDFVPFPLPEVRGEAALPSVIEVFVNNAMRLRQEVPPGPFTITDLPVITGSGDIRLVVRDTLGREAVVSQPYFASPVLLRRGVHDYSYELGAPRRDFGRRSNAYGRAFGAATHRLGLSDRYTGEIRLEGSRDHRAGGLALSTLVGGHAVVTMAGAASRRDDGRHGQLYSARLDVRFGRLSWGGGGRWTDASFTQLGALAQPPPRRTLDSHFAWNMARAGSLGLAYVRQDGRAREDDVELASINYNLTPAAGMHLHVSVLRRLHPDRGRAVFVTLSKALGSRRSAHLHGSRQNGRRRSALDLQQNLPAGPGFGYRVRVEAGREDRAQAGAALRTRIGTYRFEADATESADIYRVQASGGVIASAAGVFWARRVQEAFAIVHAPDLPDIPIIADNQIVAHTDDDGYAVVPNLRPYQNNTISIDVTRLPWDAQFDGTSKRAAPYWGSGVLVRFPIQRTRPVTARVRLSDGRPLPPHALVRVAGRSQDLPVGLDGFVYLPDVDAAARVHAVWDEGECFVDLPTRLPQGPMPDLGVLVCLPPS